MLQIWEQTAHRPWPLPAGPWIMAQSWHDLLFAHWPVDASILRPHIPSSLKIDTWDGAAWVGMVPFRMSGVRLRGMPALPWLSAFPELNVRTYVTAGEKPGVWFFSLDAGNPLAVAIARTWFHLTYFRASMACAWQDGWIQYYSRRTHTGAPSAILECRYQPAGSQFEPLPHTIEHFLTERYCLYAAASASRIYRGEIHHPPWQLQAAVAEFESNTNTMAEAAGLTLAAQRPLLHFAKRQDMVAWPPRLLEQ